MEHWQNCLYRYSLKMIDPTEIVLIEENYLAAAQKVHVAKFDIPM